MHLNTAAYTRNRVPLTVAVGKKAEKLKVDTFMYVYDLCSYNFRFLQPEHHSEEIVQVANVWGLWDVWPICSCWGYLSLPQRHLQTSQKIFKILCVEMLGYTQYGDNPIIHTFSVVGNTTFTATRSCYLSAPMYYACVCLYYTYVNFCYPGATPISRE